MTKSSVICIGGMHRSGTSLVASWLWRCGLAVHDGRVLGANPGNPMGHFEDADFLHLHEQLYLKVSPKSKNWIMTNPVHINQLSLEGTCAEALVSERCRKFPLWGWKDPRTSLMLSQWKKLIPDMKLLWIWRPVEEVVSSLIRRYQNASGARSTHLRISGRQAIDLWKRCNEKGLEFASQHPQDTVTVALKDMLACDAAVIERLNALTHHPLQFVPFQTVYRDELMNRRAAMPLALRWARWMIRRDAEVAQLTSRLTAHSLSSHPSSCR